MDVKGTFILLKGTFILLKGTFILLKGTFIPKWAGVWVIWLQDLKK